MQSPSLESSPQRPTAPTRGDLRSFSGKYLNLTSYKRDGTGVTTPLWFVIENGRVLVRTDAQSGKVKRVRRNPTVTIVPCSATGRMHGEPMPARAEVLPQSDVAHVDQLIARKYRVDRVLILPVYRAMARLRGALETDGVALAITPVSPGSNAPAVTTPPSA